MAIKLTGAMRDFVLNSGWNSAFDGGTGIIELRSGSAPTNAGDALTGTVGATIALPSDAFNAASGGSMSKAGTWQDTSADASITVGYAVMRLSGDPATADDTVRRILLTVTGTGGGGDIELQNLSINSGQSVTITTATITQPAS